jgi:hypothetical protein
VLVVPPAEHIADDEYAVVGAGERR